MDMLAITNLQKCFGDKSVLKGLDLSVPEHSVFGFIGKNGAGKTTTMKTILGLLKADGGEILVSGEGCLWTDGNKQTHWLSTRCTGILSIYDSTGISLFLR